MANELDRLVHGGVLGDRQIAQLVGADPERGAHRGIELPDRAAAERLDPAVDRADALDGAVGDLPGERAVSIVEALGRRAEGAIGVGVLLEDAQHDVVGRPARRRGAHCRSPRRNSS